MKLRKISLLLIPLAAIIVSVAVWGPEALARYRDRGILNQIRNLEAESGTEGYRYSLSSNEKLYILSRCLNNQIQPQSDQNAMTWGEGVNLDYEGLTGIYAMVVNRKDSAGQEIPQEQGIELCNNALEELKELGIIPASVRPLRENAYSAVMYSAIDVPEPRNNVAVWKMSLSNSQMNANKENRLLDAYIDADDGRIYEFYVRTPLRWEEIDTDKMIEKWSEYMGLDKPGEYETDNPLLETTPYYKKYAFDGAGNERTIVTIGFYEGINELFLKISK